MSSSSKEYDLLLFGVTGFTGKLALEYLLEKNYKGLKFGIAARNETKALDCVKLVCERLSDRTGNDMGIYTKLAPKKVEVVDLVVNSKEDEAKLRSIVRKTKVCITTAGPFEKYGQALVKVCAEEGVHYADITGESDFFRMMIERHDSAALKSGAIIVPHCGNDCIPWDLSVFEMNEYAKSQGSELVEVSTYTEVPSGTAMSGGTLNTAIYQLGKKRSKSNASFDPLLRLVDGSKSEFTQKNVSPKSDVYVSEFKRNGGPWIMGPVMANCVRRSNALLGYNKELIYSECLLRETGWVPWVQAVAYECLVTAAVVAPFLFQRFLPAPGEGPSRATMNQGWLKVHARGTMRNASNGVEVKLMSQYAFYEDTTYLSTAKFLVEAGRLLLELKGVSGVVTPSVAFGSKIVDRLATEIGSDFRLSEVPN